MSSERERFGQVLDVLQASIQEEAADLAAEEIDAWLGERPLDAADRAALAAIGGRRLFLYRRLVRKGLRSAIRVEIPRTAARLGERFDVETDAYFRDEMPRSHYLRDVAFEFVEWAAPRWERAETIPGYLADLARHELTAFEVAGAPAAADEPAEDDLALDRGVAFDPAARIRHYRYAVHRLLADLRARDEPEAKETWLLAYRDTSHDVRYLDLTPVAAAILEGLLAGETLGTAVAAGAARHGLPLGDEVLSGTAKLLADLAERGVVVGARARPEAVVG